MNNDEIDRQKFSDYGLPLGGADDRCPTAGCARSLPAKREVQARRAMIHDVPTEQMNPRRQTPTRATA